MSDKKKQPKRMRGGLLGNARRALSTRQRQIDKEVKRATGNKKKKDGRKKK